MVSSYIFNSNRIINKLILNFAIIAAVIFALDFAIGRSLRYFYFKETSGFHFRTTYAMETTVADVIVFGSSRANHHYVPEAFEEPLKASFYNTGRDGQGIFFQTALLKSILKRYVPKIIILDYEGNLKLRANEYDSLISLLPYYRTHPEIRGTVEMKGPFEWVKLFSEIYPFNSQILSIAIGNLERNKSRNPDHKGYVALYGKWMEKLDVPEMDSRAVDAKKLAAFQEFIAIAKNAGAKAFVIYSPIFQRLNVDADVEVAKNICKLNNVPFLNVSNDEQFLNNALFQDKGHLNHKGALMFSKLIVQKIKGTIPDSVH